jgi:hypothetical protein
MVFLDRYSILDIAVHYRTQYLVSVPVLFLDYGIYQGCGSGSGDFVDPDPYWESGSRIRGQEN